MESHKQINLSLFIDNFKCKSYGFYTTCILILLMIGNSTSAQKQNNIWCFGDSAGIDFNDPANPLPIITSLDTRGSCVSIADSLGQLLFYANTRAATAGNTTRVWNKLNQLMENGDSIVGSGWYNELIIVPFPGSDRLYYLFSVGVTSNFGLFYSIIDMSENSGLGKVIIKNFQLETYRAWDGMTAVKHANGRDWWLITKDWSIGSGSGGNNLFHKYLITPDSVWKDTQAIGNIILSNAGCMTFSKSGTRFLFSEFAGFAEVFEFDRCSGLFSNSVIVSNGGSSYATLGSAFSPNGNLVYLSYADTDSRIIQYDLTSTNIPASADTICTVSISDEAGGALRLAPDNKIYWSNAWYNGVNFNYPYQDTMYNNINMNLSVINDPDVVGSGCNFSLYSFSLGGKRTYWGLPNNPDYSMGPIDGSICDSITSDITQVPSNNIAFEIYPNPCLDLLNVYLTKKEFTNIHVELIDLNGRILIMKDMDKEYLQLDLKFVENGIYLLRILSDQFYSEKKLIKMN